MIHARNQGIGAGDLTLDNFILNLELGDDWINGSTLVLMTYDGTLFGTPDVTFGDLPFIFSYDDLLTDNGEIRLTNVVVPEPSSLTGMLLLTLVGLRRRR